MDIFFSLIMATLGRKNEVEDFCESLKTQKYKNFELIIVDQNKDNLLEDIVDLYKNDYKIIHIKSNKLGLSYNRNIGLKYATGEVIAFPDDDCTYEFDTLDIVNSYLVNNNNVNYYCFNSNDLRYPELSRYGDEKIKVIKNKDFYSYGISYTLFVRKDSIEGFNFDEQLGCGTFFGSGEETDLLLFLLTKKNRCIYNGLNYVHHPYKPRDNSNIERAYSYALGYGAIHKKAIFKYHNINALGKYIYAIIKNIVGLIISRNKKYHRYSLKGKIKGFYSYNVLEVE